MQVRIHDSADEFLAIAEPIYRRDPIANTIELSVLGAAMPDDALLLSVWQNCATVGVAMQTPPYPLACNGIPAEHAGSVAQILVRILPDLTGVRGSRDTAFAFPRAWESHGGPPGTVVLDERLYRLGALRPPTRVAGAPRWAQAADRDVVIDWVGRFFGEAATPHRGEAAGARFVDAAAERGDRFLLWNVDATPVSMALLRAAAAGVSRIGPVFTPTNRRANGYASAVTAAASRAARDRGDAGVVLFTDPANPTSNAIYQRIGYAPVSDFVRIDFRAVD